MIVGFMPELVMEFLTGVSKGQSEAMLFAGNPISNFANTINGFVGPTKLFTLAVAGLFWLVWSGAHATGGEGLKRKSKSGWIAAALGAGAGYAGASIVQWASSQGSSV